MSDSRDLLLTLAVLAIFALIGVGGWQLFQPGPKLRPALMVLAGLVMLFNLWLYLLPVPAGVK